jgi:hypothetical protein
MPNSGKRVVLGKGKGYLSLAGPQYRFIIFLLLVLGAYTLLLKVFLKLAEFVLFPVFFPIALVSLLVFIGLVGSVYSHTFAGPLLRIRRALQHLAEGDSSISLRLRDSDDPILKEIVKDIAQVCEHHRNAQAMLRDTTKDLLQDINALHELVHAGADKKEILKLIESIHKKQAPLDKALKSLGKE